MGRLIGVRCARFCSITHVSHAQTDRQTDDRHPARALKVKQVMVRFSRLKMAAVVGGEDALKVIKKPIADSVKKPFVNH